MDLRTKLLALSAASLVSAAGILHLKDSEGLHRIAYPDPGTGGAPWTICYGHTGPEVVPGLRVTQDQCELWLYEDIAEAERHVKHSITQPIKQGEYDAHVNFVYNIGPAKYRSSTLLRKFNAGDRRGSCNEFPRWKYADGKVLNGLVTRRYKEQSMCHLPGAYIYDPRTPRLPHPRPDCPPDPRYHVWSWVQEPSGCSPVGSANR